MLFDGVFVIWTVLDNNIHGHHPNLYPENLDCPENPENLSRKFRKRIQEKKPQKILEK